jgi:hypothetical protein
MQRFYPSFALALMLSVATISEASEPLDVRVGLDVRGVTSDATQSFLDGGLGRVRFDEDHNGLRFGQAYLAARYRFSDALSLQTDVLAYGDSHGGALDITQAYLQFRPFPQGPIRFSSKVGVFYPAFSMEHRGPAWTTVYTLTPSAINTWFGEELRAIGAEIDMRWLGASAGYQGDIGLIGGVYGWNDPIGTEVAARGWALHDRQTGLFGYLPAPAPPVEGGKIYEFREIDGRPGYYVGAEWRHGDRLDVRIFQYDNRADPGAFQHVYAWLTRFYAIGARWEADEHWTLISQALTGETYIGPRDSWGMEWDMRAWFALASYERGKWRFSGRYDSFRTEQRHGYGAPLMDDDGDALTLSTTWSFTREWSAAIEWLRITSTFGARENIGLAPQQTEKQLQLAIRYQTHW